MNLEFNGMKKLHLISCLCFLVAIALYAIEPYFGLGLGVLGFVFELAAWVYWIKGHREDLSENLPNKDKEQV